MIKIEQAKAEDLKDIANIEAICFPQTEACGYEEFVKRYEVFRENFLVARKDDQIVGFINGNETSQRYLPDCFYSDASLHDPKGIYMTVFGIDVLPTYQHQGIASMLMHAYIDLARKKGKEGIILTCKDRLLPFYESFGYKKLQDSLSSHGGAKWNDMFLEI
ncbi:Predicted N-acetyltransferase YhbS [Sharpea azabuensis]|uniref:GNAT family N-acetyltransferase n=1 Tax=Sharpea azabuensis TaxID=322505 RepID=UPI0008EE4F13|nr:GNAT family N-acetyltransferase [Sharpea azabuensis]SFD74151.1 Predicted N-acetyltransferase YhbS [Sharpea azabuensis]SFK76136.1 Predicted N-acetyltransferase YhbS [Sharpea azabuensis]